MIDEKAMRKKRSDMLQTAILHHGNLSHRAAQTTETIKDLALNFKTTPLTHQTWPLVILFYFHSSRVLRGTRFEDVADFQVQFSWLSLKYQLTRTESVFFLG